MIWQSRWGQARCKNYVCHWRSGGGDTSKKGKDAGRSERDPGILEAPPGLGVMIPLSPGAHAGIKDRVPDLSVVEVRQLIDLANKGYTTPSAQCYDCLLVAQGRSAAPPQVRADQANRAIAT
eukprot:8589245-Pyramimonas_sp.AAC.1